MEENDFQMLVDHCNQMAEQLLLEQSGEFYPFGAKIENNGQLKNIGIFNGDDFPLSTTVIQELKNNFEKEIYNERIRAYAIAYDCLAQKDPDAEKLNTIAISCCSRINDQRITFYYPYRLLANKELVFGEPWGSIDAR